MIVSFLVTPAKAGMTVEGRMEKQFFVYMMASQKNGTLCIGVTSDLKKRVWEHKNNVVEGFAEKYDVHDLVWYEPHENAESAITREKQMRDNTRKADEGMEKGLED